MLGGSSAINGLIYIRGQKEDFDGWRDLGNPGWGYDDLLPYFIKCEDQERGPNKYHGAGGMLQVSDMRLQTDISDAFIEGAREIGVPMTNDFNGESQEGAGYYQLTARNGLRCSTAKGYLRPAKSRANLQVTTHAHVTEVKIESNQAKGIVYQIDGTRHEASATREVILCAGAINSPQLLMLSGIGDAERLQELSIPVQANLVGVGKNLQDHLQIRAVYRCNVPTLNDEISNPFRRFLIGLRFVFLRSGPMTMAASQAGIFTRSSPDVELPDIQFHFQPLSADSPGEGVHPYSGVTSSVTQLRPESRGELRLQSPDPFDYPKILPNYLSAELDQKVVVRAMRFSRKIFASHAMRNLIAEEKIPGPHIKSDEELLDCARSIGETIYHPTCTCKMGPASDPSAVVDHRLSVHGIDRLRVVDASIMPTLTSGNTNAPTAALAEKASDLILEDR